MSFQELLRKSVYGFRNYVMLIDSMIIQLFTVVGLVPHHWCRRAITELLFALYSDDVTLIFVVVVVYCVYIRYNFSVQVGGWGREEAVVRGDIQK